MGCVPLRLCKGARATPGSRPWLADSLISSVMSPVGFPREGGPRGPAPRRGVGARTIGTDRHRHRHYWYRPAPPAPAPDPTAPVPVPVVPTGTIEGSEHSSQYTRMYTRRMPYRTVYMSTRCATTAGPYTDTVTCNDTKSTCEVKPPHTVLTTYIPYTGDAIYSRQIHHPDGPRRVRPRTCSSVQEPDNVI
jgi:hypothetical protein